MNIIFLLIASIFLFIFASGSLNYLVFWHYKEVFLVALLKEDHDVG